MDKPAKREATHNSQEPQDEQDDKQRPQHRLTPEISLSFVRLPFTSAVAR